MQQRSRGKIIGSGETALMLATSGLQKGIVEFLLSRKEVEANINAVSKAGDTALIRVFSQRKTHKQQEQYDIVKLLLDHGVDPTMRNGSNDTALDMAKEDDCHQKLISLLANAEASWNKKHKASSQAR